MNRFLPVCILGLLLSPILGAQDRAAQVEEILSLNGSIRQYEGFSETMGQLNEQMKGSSGADASSVIARIILEEFSGASISARVKDYLIDHFDQESCDAIRAAYADPLFLRITEDEVAASSAEFQARLESYDYGKVPDERDKLYAAMLDSLHAVETQERSLISAMRAYFSIFNLILPRDRKLGQAVIEGAIDSVRDMVRSEEFLMQLKTMYAIIYGGYTEEELLRYMALYESPEGRWMSEAADAGFREALVDIMEASAQRIIEELGLQAENT